MPKFLKWPSIGRCSKIYDNAAANDYALQRAFGHRVVALDCTIVTLAQQCCPGLALPMHTEDNHLLGKDGCTTIQFWPHLRDGIARAALYGESEDIEIEMSGTSAVNDNCDLKLQFEKVEHSSIVDQAAQQE